ncbi:hypothetical protein [Aeromonas veronii]|uniref:hypothetical protein n=1 Tax=Aeromonas veronii TaxID=654 RepID=UPI0013023A36|nr:hypothetical protein [Aeromonas veronii]KAE9635719.1 hypothetical protein GO977_07445 [Aeromonas veronii]
MVMSFRSPRDIEVKFKRSLGVIGPLMCVADMASKELINKTTNDDMSKLLKRYNHRNLNLKKVDLSNVRLYVNLAHIAYINSRAEMFCEDVVEFIKVHTGNSENYNMETLDFLRKCIFHVHARKKHLPKNTKKPSENELFSYSGKEELLVIDYFRKLRNSEFHGGVEDIISVDEEDNELIFKKFGRHLCDFHQIDIRDVILYSMAWQSAAKKICSKLVNIDAKFLDDLKRRYVNLSPERLNNAMRQKLTHDYLQSADLVDILEKNGWVA